MEIYGLGTVGLSLIAKLDLREIGRHVEFRLKGGRRD